MLTTQSWCLKNWLDLNKLSKFSNVNSSFNRLNIADTKLQIMSTNKIKYLCLIINKNHKYTDQINTLYAKLRRFIHKFLIERILRYGIIVWGGMYNKVLQPLLFCQNFTLKLAGKTDVVPKYTYIINKY